MDELTLVLVQLFTPKWAFLVLYRDHQDDLDPTNPINQVRVNVSSEHGWLLWRLKMKFESSTRAFQRPPVSHRRAMRGTLLVGLKIGKQR